MRNRKVQCLVIAFIACISNISAQAKQWVEGFDTAVFHYNVNRSAASRDFRGMARGLMTAGWWAEGQMKNNTLSWKTAQVPAKQPTTFAFIGATSVLPYELSRGPLAKLSVNGKYVLSFTLGFNKDFVWREGDYELRYISKRVEYPYFSSHRELELNGNSGIFQLSIPASDVQAGQPITLQVDIPLFKRWNNGWFMVKDRKDVLKHSMEILEGEIEALRMDVATLNAQTHILATQVYKNIIDTIDFQHEVIYGNGYRHLHPADIIKLKNGELLIMTREASEHYAPDGDVVMLRSKDGGKTWGNKKVIASLPNSDEREGCGIQLKDGTIIMGVFYNNLYNPDGSYNFNSGKRIEEPGKHYLGAYIVTSKDNGHTWSQPNYIDTKDMPFKNLEGPTDAPIEMPDGSIVMGLIGYSPHGDAGNRAAVMIRSIDKGKTWKYLATMANDPGGKLGGFLEPGIVRTKTGRIVTGLRNHGPEQAIWVTYSDDDGKTWAPVLKTQMIGHPVDLIQLKDGRLMATYGIRTGPHVKPGGIRACFSKDNGETWDIKTEVQIRNDFLNWDAGYPESLQMPDGKVLTVYYYNLFNKYFLGGTYWKP
ncbi:MAG: sialidase family protein [Segetibacter sp.]